MNHTMNVPTRKTPASFALARVTKLVVTKLVVSATLSLAFFALQGCGNENIAACTAYVDAANSALIECGSEPLYTVEENCPESLASGPDCSAYYTCLAEGYTCTAATQTVTATISECTC